MTLHLVHDLGIESHPRNSCFVCIFNFSQCPSITSLPCTSPTKPASLGVKRQADHSPPSSAEVKE